MTNPNDLVYCYQDRIKSWSEDRNQVQLILIQANFDPRLSYIDYKWIVKFAELQCRTRFT